MTFVIAEAGVNHNGSLWTATELARAAKNAGADAVKYQYFSSQKLWGDDRIKNLEFSADQLEAIAIECDELGIEFVCTAFGIEELRDLMDIGIKRIKIPSGLVTNRDLLHEVANSGLPIILSTGMSDSHDLIPAMQILRNREVTILHCTSAYPCPLEEVNLRAMDTLRDLFEYPVGYSDHTQGITVSIAAVARGAVVIEKHLTLDRNSEGPDHKSSIEPEDFSLMVKSIREVEQCLGDGVKRVMDSEKGLREVWRSR